MTVDHYDRAAPGERPTRGRREIQQKGVWLRSCSHTDAYMRRRFDPTSSGAQPDPTPSDAVVVRPSERRLNHCGDEHGDE